jgi:phage gp46-like protein
MQVNDPCLEQNVGQRRIFWTTRAEACGDYTLCGRICSIPGLEYEDSDEPEYRTIKTNGWLHGLILNILNTRARTDLPCSSPAATFGRWSESYRDDNLYIGSTMWNAAEKSYIRIADAVKAIANAVKADMGKLVAMGLAQSVEVEATYRGSNVVAVAITTVTVERRSTINLSGSCVSETWVWH